MELVMNKTRTGRKYFTDESNEVVQMECNKCHEVKSIYEFTRMNKPGLIGGRSPQCKDCRDRKKIKTDITGIKPKVINGLSVITSGELREALGLSNSSLNLNFQNNRELFEEGEHYTKRGRYIYWTLEGCALHISILRDAGNEVVENIKTIFNAPELEIKQTKKIGYASTSKEGCFGELLYSMFKGVTEVKRQYSVLNYRIDFYLPEYNIAIEFDEKHHKRQQEEDRRREEDIKREIGCSFIRVSESDDIGESLNKIMRAILL